MINKRSVLFLCTGNSARSQMAEALLRFHAGDQFEVYSAGTQPMAIPEDVYEVLTPFNVAHGTLRSKHVDEFSGRAFDYVITLCDKAQNECRRYAGNANKLEWSFADPYSRSGPYPFQMTLSEINQRIHSFISLETKAKLPDINFHPVDFYKQLTDEVRLRCLMLIQYEGELCVCELMAAIDDIQPKISRNLALLRKAGLLVDRRQGQWVFYRINPDLPTWVKTVLRETTEHNVAFFKESIERLSQMSERPQRAALCC